ncbi:hypothetical protein Trydic_g7, partial [Trypoxylus dichotomus]
FTPLGHMTNTEFYRDVLKQLMEDLRRKHPVKWTKNDLILYGDNARLHTAFIKQRFLTKKRLLFLIQQIRTT